MTIQDILEIQKEFNLPGETEIIDADTEKSFELGYLDLVDKKVRIRRFDD